MAGDSTQTARVASSTDTASAPLSSELQTAIKKYQEPRELSADTTLQHHIPSITALIQNRTTSDAHTRGARFAVLGDEVLSNLVPALSNHFSCDAPHDESYTSHRVALSSEAPLVVDLTVSGDTIANTLFRLNIGLFQTLSDLFRRADRSSLYPELTIIVHVGTHDLVQGSGKKDRPVLKPRSICAFSTLLSMLLNTAENANIVVVGRVFRGDVGMDLVQQASSKLREATLAISRHFPGRILYYEAPLTLRVEHLDTDTILDADACFELARDLHSRIADFSRQSNEPADHQQGTEQMLDGRSLPLRPAQDVLNRILHDKATYDPDQIIVGYIDRHEGIQEMSAGRWRKDSTDEDFIPLHRIRYFMHAAEQPPRLLWDREKRIDNVFRASV